MFSSEGQKDGARMDQENRQIAVYSRKSKFTGRGESIENQIGLCRQYIKNFYGDQEEQRVLVYEDEGFSGGNLKRPQFRNMMRDAEHGKIKAVVVYRLDRISRNIGDFAGLIEKLGNMGISFVSIREQFDTSSPMGRAMMYIASVFSQLERETIAERIRDNMYELAKTGRWLGGNTPTGYRSEAVTTVHVDGKARKACKLKLLPEEAALVRQIYQEFLAVRSLADTGKWLLQNGCVTKNGNPFGPVAIKNILENPVYAAADQDTYRYFDRGGACLCASQEEFDGCHGIMAYNRTLQKPGKAHKVRPMEEWVVAVGKHEPVVSGEEWCRVQKFFLANKKKGCRRQKSGCSLLAGLLFCGECGAFMRPKLSGRTEESGERKFSYLCTVKEKSRMASCSIKNADGSSLDRAVLDTLAELPEDRGEFIRLLNKKIRELNREVKAEAGGAGAEHGSESGPEHGSEYESENGSEHMTGEQLLDMRMVISCLPPEQKKEAVRTLVSCIRWNGQSAHVYLVGAGEE